MFEKKSPVKKNIVKFNSCIEDIQISILNFFCPYCIDDTLE